MRLYTKLLLAFLLVILLAVLIVAALANQVARREVGGLMTSSGMTTTSSLAAELAGYYQGHGGWEGVEALLDPGRGHGRMMGQRLLLAGADGVVIYDTAGLLGGQALPPADLAAGEPIVVGATRVGTLLVYQGMMGGQGMGAPATSLLARVYRSIWLGAVAAGLAAAVVGGLLAYGLLRPIGALTRATALIARGDLSQRVPPGSRDELGDLGAAFNRMAASLEDAERLRREMTADLAHELRNPIAVLQGSLEAVVDGVLPPTPDNLQPLLDQTQLLTRLVDDLRTLALAEAGQLSLERAPVDPAALAHSAAAQFQAAADGRGVRLSVEAAPGLPPVTVDRQRIGQVLANLLSNALRHTPEGGRVVCRVSRDLDGAGTANAGGTEGGAAGITFVVADTGPGIPAEALPHVFQRFYRVDGGRARAEGGTGLGLTIARQLVEAHGGTIWARSEPGQGAEVGFSLPAGV
jgi:signal transduction histidine kinase